MKVPQKIAVFIHRLYYDNKIKKGGLDQITDYLIANGDEIVLFEFPLDYDQSHTFRVTSIVGERRVSLLNVQMPQVRSSMLWTLEVVYSLYYSLKLLRGVRTCITSDPLMTFPALLLRKIGFYRFLYFHSVDYSETRFKNKILDKIYFILLKVGLGNADLVGCVTQTVQSIMAKQHIKNTIFVPNSPSMQSLNTYRKSSAERRKYNLVVTCAGISQKYRINDTIILFEQLLSQFNVATLTLIGSIGFDPRGYSQVTKLIESKGLAKKVELTGQLSKPDNLRRVSEAWVGLAFYDTGYSHVNFGDSLKIREYAALGIPTVSDKTTPTSYEMEANKAGVAIDNPSDAYPVIAKLFNDHNYYEEIAANALNWAYAMDKDKIMKQVLERIK